MIDIKYLYNNYKENPRDAIIYLYKIGDLTGLNYEIVIDKLEISTHNKNMTRFKNSLIEELYFIKNLAIERYFISAK